MIYSSTLLKQCILGVTLNFDLSMSLILYNDSVGIVGFVQLGGGGVAEEIVQVKRNIKLLSTYIINSLEF